MPFKWMTVYVVELDDGAPLPTREDPRLPFLYVGVTGNTPERRFEIHKEGGRTASSIVTEHGVRSLPHLYQRYKRVRKDRAAALEQKVAEDLRAEGYVVYSGKAGFFWDKYKDKTSRESTEPKQDA